MTCIKSANMGGCRVEREPDQSPAGEAAEALPQAWWGSQLHRAREAPFRPQARGPDSRAHSSGPPTLPGQLTQGFGAGRREWNTIPPAAGTFGRILRSGPIFQG